MIIWVIRILMVVVLLAIIHTVMGLYLRHSERARLKDEFRSDPMPGMSRSEYIGRGMAAYERSWSKRLLWLIWLAPIGIGGLLLIIAANM